VVRARFFAHPAVDAAKQIDLVALGVALAWRDAVLGRVLGCLDYDAADRTSDGAQLAASTFLQAVGVAVKDMRAALPGRHRLLALRVLDGDDRPGVVLESRHQRAGDANRAQKDLAQSHQRLRSA